MTSSDEKTGGFGLSIEPDPRRYESCVINVEEYRSEIGTNRAIVTAPSVAALAVRRHTHVGVAVDAGGSSGINAGLAHIAWHYSKLEFIW